MLFISGSVHSKANYKTESESTCVNPEVRFHIILAHERLVTILTTERFDAKMALHVRAETRIKGQSTSPINQDKRLHFFHKFDLK